MERDLKTQHGPGIDSDSKPAKFVLGYPGRCSSEIRFHHTTVTSACDLRHRNYLAFS